MTFTQADKAWAPYDEHERAMIERRTANHRGIDDLQRPMSQTR
jgi:hypothetical protein